MPKELKHTEISEIQGLPELVRLAEEVQTTQEPRVLTRKGKELVIVQPAATPRSRKSLGGRRLTHEDALWRLVGSASSAEPTDASKKHEYLAQGNP